MCDPQKKLNILIFPSLLEIKYSYFSIPAKSINKGFTYNILWGHWPITIPACNAHLRGHAHEQRALGRERLSCHLAAKDARWPDAVHVAVEAVSGLEPIGVHPIKVERAEWMEVQVLRLAGIGDG